jgi:endonuclease YncB( thermonuclease family)
LSSLFPKLFCAALALSVPVFPRSQDAAQEATAVKAPAWTEDGPFEIVQVVDSDTLHVLRDGKVEKLRLLCIDTEERQWGRDTYSPSKPETAYGEECARWAQEFFTELGGDGAAEVRLRFPRGEEVRDVYGRLLCHVVLPDGKDFNLMLVQSGRSPYFNKYGNSEVLHEDFVRAQEDARRGKLGVWSADVNPAPSQKRPYDKLVPWWNARAAAIDSFRARCAEAPLAVLAAERPDDLEKAAGGGEVEVFGEIFRIFDEDDGSRTVLFRANDRERALRVRIAKADVAAHARLDLDGTLAEFRQNFLYVKGKLVASERGFEMTSTGPDAWRVAGPEPQ